MSGKQQAEPGRRDPARPWKIATGILAAALVFCLGVLRRETGTWRWPVMAFVYMGVVAWVMAFLGSGIARLIT